MLDPYAARSCPVKTHHAFDPTVAQPAQPHDESLPGSFLGGADYRAVILDRIAQGNPGLVDLRELAGSRDELIAATLEAIAAGAPVILGPVLPPDPQGHRIGRPDALILGTDTEQATPGYWPMRIKSYRVRERQVGSDSLRTSSLASLREIRPLPDLRYRSFREGALLELAHFYRMLEHCGAASAQPFGAVVGDERDHPSATWVDLSTKFLRTYSKSAGYKRRSPLERYDHEHRFRVYVAEQAAQRTGVDDPPPVVRPIRVRECDWCAWWSVCRPMIDDDDLSLRISKAPLDVRELQTLMGLGITTVAQLAEADVEEILPQYLPLTGHRDRAEQRLRQAALRARMMAKGLALQRLGDDPLNVPRASVEIDLDIETADDGTVYLWGVLITDEHGTRFEHFSRFERLTSHSEIALAAEFARWLNNFIAEHPDTLVYHYSDYEPVHLIRLAEHSNHPDLIAARALIRDRFVDLFAYIRDQFVGVDGLGLKVVATAGAGFSWRDSEPGGLASQTWFNDAVSAPELNERLAATRRVLEYNEDDVRATLAVRNWLTAQDR